MEPAAATLLTTPEIADLLKIHPKQVYRLLRRGLPGRRVGGEWRFLRDEVLSWVTRGAPATGGTRRRAIPEAIPDPEAADPEAGSLPPFLAANGDIAVEKLLAFVNTPRPILGFLQSDRDHALHLLQQGAVLAAGCHGKGPPPRLGAMRLARIHLVRREVGLVAATGKRLPRLSEIGRLRFAIRPPSAGIMMHLEAVARRERQPMKKLLARAQPLESHREVVCAILRDDADVGLTTRAWADRTGLAFHPLAAESYGLLVRAGDLGDRRVVRLCEVAQSEAYRRAVMAIPGYDLDGAGDIRYDPDAAGAKAKAAKGAKGAKGDRSRA